MALIDTDVRRTFATGIAGFSHVIDSLSAIKYAKVKVVRDESGLATGFETEGDFPKYGNDDDRADEIGVWLLKTFLEMIKKRHTYPHSEAPPPLPPPPPGVWGRTPTPCPYSPARPPPFSPACHPPYAAQKRRAAGFPELGGKAALPLGTGRYLQHPDHQPGRSGPQ